MRLPGEPLPELPAFVLRRGSRLARIHHHTSQPWHLASDANSRFNLDPPSGTCYLAVDPICSFMEVFARASVVINLRVLEQYRLTWFSLRRDWRLADLTDPKARRAGLDARIHSSTDYEVTRAWARAISDAGYAGIRYRPRSDLSGSLTSIALFSYPRGPKLRVLSSEVIPDELISRAREQYGMKIIPALFRDGDP